MIDVLVSAYKQENFLSKCLDSILDQKINCNIILINPKPTGEYFKIIESYKDNIKTFIHEEIEVAIGMIIKPNLLKKETLIIIFKVTDIMER